MSTSPLSTPSLPPDPPPPLELADLLGNLAGGSAPFYLSLVLGTIALVLAVVMILRAKKPLQLPPLQSAPGVLTRLRRAVSASPRNKWQTLFNRAVASLRFLSTRREWRYETPWVLLLGEKSAGKSSIAASLTSGRRTTLLLREKLLALEGTDWHFYNDGVVIDPIGDLPAATADSADGKAWRSILDAIEAHRPERPLDAIVLAVSARTLLQTDYDSRQHLAEQCYEQLFTLQKHFEFAYPVYVVVSQCDAIKGFCAFWQAQGEGWQPGMWGWSNPGLQEERAMADCVASAWDILADNLRRQQIEAAASGRDIPDSDGFFLFPEHFAKLQAPLGGFLDVVFRPSVYHASFYLRGIYCTGSPAADGAAKEGSRDDVACADDFFERRVFAEKNLARPVRESIWSRNRLLRRLQIAAIGGFAALALTLASASYQLDRKTQALSSALATIKQNTGNGETCQDKATVFKLLDEISEADTDLQYLLIPASWFDSRIMQNSALQISESAFKNVIMPSLQCHLEQRAQALLAGPAEADKAGVGGEAVDGAKDVLDRYLAEAEAFERHRRAFDRISRTASVERMAEQLALLDGLMRYVYGEGLPIRDKDDAPTYAQVLTKLEYSHRLVLDKDEKEFKEAVAGHIGDMTGNLFKTTVRTLDQGRSLVQRIKDEQAPVLGTLTEFDRWLVWVGKNWLASNRDQNPCRAFGTAIGTKLKALADFDYPPKIQAAINRFQPDTCYDPAMARLAALELPPYGNLFEKRGSVYAIPPAIDSELRGMRQLAAQDFMQLQPREVFECLSDGAGWRPQALDEANRYIRDYQAFARLQGADALAAEGKRPLYDRLARRQLQTVLDQILSQGQIPSPTTGILAQVRTDALSGGDQELAQRSGDFAKVVDPLVRTLDLYRQLGFNDSANRINQCARNFAARVLLRADALAEESRLYQPGGDKEGNGPVYTLGSSAETKDYLSRQLQRSLVLANYAAPFVAFLKNGEAVDDSKQANNQSQAYWDNTLSELRRYVQFKEPNGQVAHLENYFLKQLADLRFDSCGKTLASYQAETAGNDLFSERRRFLQKDAGWRCNNRREAEIYAQYRNLANRFNRELAGRFPFGPLSGQDASPAMVRSFFADFDSQREILRDALANLGDKHDSRWQSVRQFIDSLDKSALFFRSYLTAGDAPLPLRANIGFHAQPRPATGAEQIVSWRLSSGINLASFPNGTTTLDWKSGEMLLLELEWANQSRFRPVADPQQNDMQVDGNVASFVSMGDWALLRFIAGHRSRTDESLDGNRVGIELNIPVSSQKVGPAPGQVNTARAHLTVALASTDPKNQAAAPLRLPAFPNKAPLLW